MTTKADWKNAGHDPTAAQITNPGEPPATEEMLAHLHGTLPAADARRVQQWLDANPDVARALAQPFPADDAKPGDPDHLPEEELSRRWAALRKEVQPAARVVRFPAMTALAAAVALVFAGLYWQEVRHAETPLLVSVSQEVEPVGRRRGPGGDETPLDLTQPRTGVAFKLTSPDSHSWYRIEIWPAAGDPAKPLWTSDPTPSRRGGLEMILSKGFLRPGVYWIKAFGLDDRQPAELADQYLVRVH